jgi:hypothetical protein
MIEIARTAEGAAEPAPIRIIDRQGAAEWVPFVTLREEADDHRNRTGGEAATIDAVTRLLAQMERTALAQRAGAVHQAPAPVPMYAAPQAHPGVAVHVPGAWPVLPVPEMTRAVDKPRDIWPLVFMVSGCTGLGSAAAAAATGSQFAVLAVFGCFAAWGTAAYRLVFAR